MTFDLCVADWQLILEYLKVLLSWPPVTLVLIVLCVRVFRKNIALLINRIRGGKGPGGIEFSADPHISSQETGVLPPPTLPPKDGTDALSVNSSNPELARAEILKWWGIARYESALNRIFGTQFEVLKLLLAQKVTGESIANLSPFYLEHEKLAQAGGQRPISMGEFFTFLTHLEFLRIDPAPAPEGRAFITPLGQEFLEHVFKTYGPQSRKPW